MLIHKSKLMIVTNCEFKNKILNLKLNNKQFIIENYEGPQFKCGRFCIINTNSKNNVTDLYLLDNNYKPFQVYGKFDILDEGTVVYDETKDFSKENAYATQICVSAFGSLFKSEIELNKDLLLELENKIFDFILSDNLGWKSSKKRVLEIILNSNLPKLIIEKICNQIAISPMPKNALSRKTDLNLEDYADSVFVKI